MDNAAAEYLISDIDMVLERLHQAQACIDAIDIEMVDRKVNPGGDQMADSVLQGLASAARELLSQATAAATREAMRPEKNLVPHV